eukprot:2835597-Ditylum_brightwellii.AAC.1
MATSISSVRTIAINFIFLATVQSALSLVVPHNFRIQTKSISSPKYNQQNHGRPLGRRCPPLNMVPRYDPTTKRWEPTKPEEEESA